MGNELNILAATLWCDRKENEANRKTFGQMLNTVSNLSNVNQIYINYETTPKELSKFNSEEKSFHPWWENHLGIPLIPRKTYEYGDWKYVTDAWSIVTGWDSRIQYDQDQKRLFKIVIARNMAIDYALTRGYSHILFVDSDVIPNPSGFAYLLKMANEGVNLCGGYVPGRGDHAHVHYVFGHMRGIKDEGGMIECDHGSCGYMLISRKVFGQLRFRWGDDRHVPGQMLSEDPAYCYDWYDISGERFLISKNATAQHIGELKESEAARDEWSTVQRQSEI